MNKSLLGQGTAPETNPDSTAETKPDTTTDERPSWLPEEYWDGGVAKVKELVTRLTDTQTALRNHKDKIRQEIEDEIKTQRPDTPIGYVLDHEKLKIDGQPINLSEDDPAYQRVRQWAYDANLSQEHFNGLIGAYVQAIGEQAPNVESEIAKLGENAKARIGNVVAEARKIIGDDAMETLTSMVRNAEQVQVLEKLFAQRASVSSFQPSTPSDNDLELELGKILDSEGWYRRDPAVLKRYSELSERLYRQTKRV